MRAAALIRVIHRRRISRLRVRRSRYIYAIERMTDSWARRKRRLRVPRWPSAICKSFLCFLCAATPRFTLGIVNPPFDSYYMTHTLKGIRKETFYAVSITRGQRKVFIHRRRRESFVQSTSPLRVDYSTSPFYWAIAYPANCPIIRVDIVLSLP